MFQWVTDQIEEASGVRGEQSSPDTRISKPKIPLWLRAVPFFSSALLFLSAFFSIFSPLPLLVLRFRAGRSWFWAAVLTNCVFVALAGGFGSLAIFMVFTVAATIALGESLIHGRSLERVVFSAFVAIIVSGLVFVLSYSAVKHVGPFIELKHQVISAVDSTIKTMVANSPETSKPPVLGGMEVEEFKEKLLLELPAALAIFALILIVVNALLVLRINPAGIAQKLGFKSEQVKFWKAPEFLVWPTIASGAFLVVDFGRTSDVMTGVFKFFLAIYALQGLSILGFFFDLWRIRGVMRAVGFGIAIFLMMPLVLSLGFFDLWFDFRGKFRQS